MFLFSTASGIIQYNGTRYTYNHQIQTTCALQTSAVDYSVCRSALENLGGRVCGRVKWRSEILEFAVVVLVGEDELLNMYIVDAQVK